MGARGMSGDGDGEGTMEATRMVRRRRPGVAALLALGVIGLALAIVAGRPGPGPVLTTIAVGSFSGAASLSVDEGAGRAYVVADSGGGSAGHAVVRVLDTTRATVVRTTALPGQPFGLTTVLVDARRGRAYAASTGSTSCSSSGGGPQTCTTTGAAVVVLDARTGQPLRTLAVDAGRGLALDGRTGLLYALPSAGGTPSGGPPTPGSGTTRVTVIDPRTGRVVRTIALPGGGGQGGDVGTLAIDARGGRLVVVRTFASGFRGSGTPPSAVDVVALVDGRLLRHALLRHAPLTAARFGPFGSLLIDEPRERAFYIAGAGVSTLDPQRGTLVRVTPTGGGVGTLVEDARTGHVFTTTLGPLRVVATGARNSGAGTQTQVPAGVGSLLMLDARSGALVRTLPIGPATTGVAVDERRGRVYVLSIGFADAHNRLTRPGTLSVVDERRGQSVRTLAVGAVPVWLALDRRHDRLLVGCIGAFGGTPDDPWGWVPGPVRRLLPFLPRPPAPTSTPQGSVLILDTTRL